MNIYADNLTLLGASSANSTLTTLEYAQLPSNLEKFTLFGSNTTDSQVHDLPLLTTLITEVNKKVSTIDEVSLQYQFVEGDVRQLIADLFKNVIIKRLSLFRTTMQSIDFSPLKSLKEFAINSVLRDPNVLVHRVYEIDNGKINGLLEQNKDLNYMQLPCYSYVAYTNIINARKGNDSFELHVAYDDNKALQHMIFTKTELTVKVNSFIDNLIMYLLGADRKFDSINVELSSADALTSVKPFFFEQIDANAVNISISQQNDGLFDPFALVIDQQQHLKEAKWTQLAIQTVINGESDTHRVKEGIQTYRQSLKHLKKLDVQLLVVHDISKTLTEFALFACNSTTVKQELLTIQCNFDEDSSPSASNIIMSAFTFTIALLLVHFM